jgi:drug/metabolite transporter (DMT)-like permease
VSRPGQGPGAAKTVGGSLPSPGPRGRGVALALVSAAGFSTLGLFAKLVYAQGFGVLTTLAWRFTLAAAMLWLVVALLKRPLPARVWPVLLLGLVGFSPQAGLYFLTLRYLDPGITSVLLYTYPSFVILLAFLLWKRRPRRIQLLALVLSLAGSVVAFWKRGDYPALGMGLGLAVGLSYGAYLVASERVLAEVDSISATALVMSAAALVYWTAAALSGQAALPASAPILAGLAGLALAATVIPIVTLFASMRILGAADTSLVSTLEPVLTIGLSALILGERLGAAQLLGGALVLAAVLILGLSGRKARA